MHRERITFVVLGQIVSILGVAIGSRVLTEFATPTALGEYKLAIGMVALFSGIFFRQFIQFVMRFYHDAIANGESSIFLDFSRRVIRKGLLWMSAGLFFAMLWYGRSNGGLGWTAACVAVGLLCMNVFTSFQYSVLITQNRQNSAVIIRTLIQCLTPLVLACGAYFIGQDGKSLLFSELVLLLLVFAISGFWLKETDKAATGIIQPERLEKWKNESARFVIPLIGVSLFSWVLGVADRYILAKYHSAHDVGVYAAVYGLGSQPMMIANGLIAQLISPILFEAAAQNRNSTEHKVLRYTLLGGVVSSTVCIAVVYFMGDYLINLLLAQEYRATAYPILIWVASGYALLALASSYELKAYSGKKTKVIGIAYGVAAAVNLVMNFILIPAQGAIGAAKATFFGYIGYLLVIVLLSRHERKKARI